MKRGSAPILPAGPTRCEAGKLEGSLADGKREQRVTPPWIERREYSRLMGPIGIRPVVGNHYTQVR